MLSVTSFIDYPCGFRSELLPSTQTRSLILDVSIEIATSLFDLGYVSKTVSDFYFNPPGGHLDRHPEDASGITLNYEQFPVILKLIIIII